MLFPLFSFGPIQGVYSASYANTRGTSPSVCRVSIPPNPSLNLMPNTMIFSDGFRTVRFGNCVVSDIEPSVDGQGFTSWNVSIYDRRWAWRYGVLAGTYNQLKGGEIVAETKKNAKELCKLCFEACGETQYDLSRVPDDVYPLINWDMVPPDAALQQLLNQINCHCCLSHLDSAIIWPDGVGSNLPSGPSSSSGEGHDFNVLPDYLGLYSGPFEWQLDLELEPLGRDVDGEIKPIDDLSYKPSVGWMNVARPLFTKVDKEHSELAKDSVWRMWRPKLPTEKLFEANLIPEKPEQLRLQNYQLEVEKIKYSEEKRRLAPVLWGLFFTDAAGGHNTKKEDDFDFEADRDLTTEEGKKLIYRKGFQIDTDKNLVITSENLVRIAEPDSDDIYQMPKIYIRCAVRLWQKDTRAVYRFALYEPTGVPKRGTKVMWRRKEDVKPQWFKDKDGDERDNLDEVKDVLKKYLRLEMKRFTPKQPAHARYECLMNVSPDGVLAQVEYSIDGAGFIGTSVSRQIENLLNVPSYEERKMLQALSHSLERESDNAAKPEADDAQ